MLWVMRMIHIKIEEMLKKKGVSKYWLVKHVDTTYPVINKMAKGRVVHMNLDVLERLCKVFECTPGDLLEIVDDSCGGEG